MCLTGHLLAMPEALTSVPSGLKNWTKTNTVRTHREMTALWMDFMLPLLVMESLML